MNEDYSKLANKISDEELMKGIQKLKISKNRKERIKNDTLRNQHTVKHSN